MLHTKIFLTPGTYYIADALRMEQHGISPISFPEKHKSTGVLKCDSRSSICPFFKPSIFKNFKIEKIVYAAKIVI